MAIARLELAFKKGSKYIMTTLMYHFNYSDGVHMSVPMSRLYGEYVGYVMKRVLVDGGDWRLVHPQGHKVKKSEKEWAEDVQFYAPVLPMALEPKAVDDPRNYGFSIVSKNGKSIPIKSVELFGKDVVRLATEADPSKLNLRYGLTIKAQCLSDLKSGARGCLRDSQGETVKPTIANREYRMDNWSPFFDYPLSGR